MPRISNLTSLTAADNSDELAIVDTSASVTKKITRGDLLKAPLPTNSVTTAAIANGAVTESKIDLTTLPAAQPAYTNATLVNSWVAYGGTFDIPGYLKDSLGFVHMRGTMKSGTTSAGTTLFTLPAGFRPESDTYLPAVSASAGNSGSIQIQSNGTVAIISGVNTFFSIGHIVFKAV